MPSDKHPVLTSLPQEDGFYIFMGHREGRHATLGSGRRPELVCINSKLPEGARVVGIDFFYHPEEAVGAWQKVDVDELVAEGQRLSREEAVRHIYAEYLTRAWWATPSRRGLLYYLEGKDHMCASLAPAEIVELAVALGLLPEEETP